MEVLKTTKIGKDYWCKNGAYSKEYEKLYKEMVPSFGEADSLNGELIRAVSRLGHEYYNNGNGNAKEIDTYTENEVCGYCSGDGQVWDGTDEVGEDIYVECPECIDGRVEEEYECEPTIDRYYDGLLILVEVTIPEAKVDCEGIRKVILQSDCNFNDEEKHKYTVLSDKIIHYVLTHDNKEIPAWYLEE